MTHREIVTQEIGRMLDELKAPYGQEITARAALQELLVFVAMLPDLTAPDGIEKGVEKHRSWLEYNGMPIGYKTASCDGFRMGAKWMAEQYASKKK